MRSDSLESLHRNRAHAQRIAEVRRDFFEFHHALGIGLFVDAVRSDASRCFQMRRHGFIGGQHELFDQPVRDVARRA